jgi:hypothetical protein
MAFNCQRYEVCEFIPANGMLQAHKLLDDDDLIVFNVIVLHDCVARERLCPSSLIELVKTYRRSPVLEVQEVRIYQA